MSIGLVCPSKICAWIAKCVSYFTMRVLWLIELRDTKLCRVWTNFAIHSLLSGHPKYDMSLSKYSLVLFDAYVLLVMTKMFRLLKLCVDEIFQSFQDVRFLWNLERISSCHFPWIIYCFISHALWTKRQTMTICKFCYFARIPPQHSFYSSWHFSLVEKLLPDHADKQIAPLLQSYSLI